MPWSDLFGIKTEIDLILHRATFIYENFKSFATNPMNCTNAPIHSATFFSLLLLLPLFLLFLLAVCGLRYHAPISIHTAVAKRKRDSKSHIASNFYTFAPCECISKAKAKQEKKIVYFEYTNNSVCSGIYYNILNLHFCVYLDQYV